MSKKRKLEEIARNAISEKENICQKKDDQCKYSLKTADDFIHGGKNKLQESLGDKNVDYQLVQKALTKIETGTEGKRKIEYVLEVLHSRKKKLSLVESLFFLFIVFN